MLIRYDLLSCNLIGDIKTFRESIDMGNADDKPDIDDAEWFEIASTIISPIACISISRTLAIAVLMASNTSCEFSTSSTPREVFTKSSCSVNCCNIGDDIVGVVVVVTVS